MKMALLIDITCHLNSQNLQLQGQNKQPGSMLHVVTDFQNKITALFIPDRQFVHFPKLRTAITNDPEYLQCFSYDAFKEVLREEFQSRLQDVMQYRDVF